MPSAHGCASQPTYKSSMTPYPSYRSFLTTSAQASLRKTTSPPTREAWSNTSAPWDRSLQTWGPQTQDSTHWDPFCLGQQFVTYTKEDPTPGRVFPLSVSILHCMDSVTQGVSPRYQEIVDLSWIALFFLLRSGEYCTVSTDTVSTPFTLRDI